MKRLESYHFAWLSVHSHRTEEWLRERLKEGFDIHHVDGNHSNNDPQNLVLIECTDHHRLHGRPPINRVVGSTNSANRKVNKKAIRKRPDGKEAYFLNKRGCSWIEIGRVLGCGRSEVSKAARKYAQSMGKRWPPLKRAEIRL